VLLAYAVARRLLFPIRNVTGAIEASSPARTVFIDRPHSRLEDLYNRMALDAVIARLHGQMRDEIARHPQMTGWEVVQLVCRIFSDQLRPTLSGCVELVAEGPGRLRATGQAALAAREPLRATREELTEALERVMPHDVREAGEFALGEFETPLEVALRIMADPERSGIRYLFVIGRDARAEGTEALASPELLGRLTDLVEAGLQGLSLRNQILVQERGRANISLSRNLGHDLTNIIATSKLELMALDRLLGGGRPPEDDRRRTILIESLHGLLRSVRFMQETVNLYRAYAFIQHPMMETHDGNELVNETLDLFAMSVSAKVDLRRELAADAPRCVVDPRLIKLALFNMFSNALEALRKADPEHAIPGWIRVVTGRSREGGLSIAVEDGGTGILNSQGERAENHEIEKIFELGYTSRRAGGGQGEGLGLNWVRTIVQDLHGGMIMAENIPDGWARFILTFPSLETVATRKAQEPDGMD
jgi:signal transduction histidine kinase